MMTEPHINSLLEKTLSIFKKEGIKELPEDELLKKLNISITEYHDLAGSKDSLLKKAIKYDQERQKLKHKELLAKSENALEELMNLLYSGLKDSSNINPAYIHDIVHHYPEVWKLMMENMESYSGPLYYNIINRGIEQNLFRKDINIEVVVKVIMGNVSLLINEKLFPPAKYPLGEVMRSIYLYYFRGLCRTESAHLVDNYFANKTL